MSGCLMELDREYTRRGQLSGIVQMYEFYHLLYIYHRYRDLIICRLKQSCTAEWDLRLGFYWRRHGWHFKSNLIVRHLTCFLFCWNKSLKKTKSYKGHILFFVLWGQEAIFKNEILVIWCQTLYSIKQMQTFTINSMISCCFPICWH